MLSVKNFKHAVHKRRVFLYGIMHIQGVIKMRSRWKMEYVNAFSDVRLASYGLQCSVGSCCDVNKGVKFNLLAIFFKSVIKLYSWSISHDVCYSLTRAQQ